MAVFAFGWGLLAVWLGLVVAGAELVLVSVAIAPKTPPAPPNGPGGFELDEA